MGRSWYVRNQKPSLPLLEWIQQQNLTDRSIAHHGMGCNVPRTRPRAWLPGDRPLNYDDQENIITIGLLKPIIVCQSACCHLEGRGTMRHTEIYAQLIQYAFKGALRSHWPRVSSIIETTQKPVPLLCFFNTEKSYHHPESFLWAVLLNKDKLCSWWATRRSYQSKIGSSHSIESTMVFVALPPSIDICNGERYIGKPSFSTPVSGRV